MDVSDVLGDLRAEVESLMTDTVSWTRRGATVTPVVIDPVTGLPTRSPDVVVFTGPCRRFSRLLPRKSGAVTSAGDAVTLETTFAEIPLSAPSLKVGDVGTVTASQYTPGDVGLVLRVVDLVQSSQALRQRALVESVLD
jgi:hypothetical protein